MKLLPSTPVTLEQMNETLQALVHIVNELRKDIAELKGDMETVFLRLERLEQEVHINHLYHQNTTKALRSAGSILVKV